MLRRSRSLRSAGALLFTSAFVLNPAGELEYWAFRDAAVRVFRMIGGNFATDQSCSSISKSTTRRSARSGPMIERS
jgi:hypothetical protein